MPETFDLDEDDVVEVRVVLGASSSFVQFSANDKTLRISDLSLQSVLEGIYTGLKVILDDSKDTTTYIFTLIVLPFEEDVTVTPSPAMDPQSSSTQTSAGDPQSSSIAKHE